MIKDIWYELTPELLADISQASKQYFWLATTHSVVVGHYEWYQGRNPDGFDLMCGGGRVGANEVTHIMLFIRPGLPK